MTTAGPTLFFQRPRGASRRIWTEGQDFDFSFDTVFDTEAKITPQGFVVRMCDSLPQPALRLERSANLGNPAGPRYPAQQRELVLAPVFQPDRGPSEPGRRRHRPGKHFSRTQFSAHPVRNFPLLPGLDLRDLDHPKFAQRDAYGQIGLDAKAVLKDKFVLDATANPDFSQIESDDPQVTVNQRFEVQFPEKRPFFLENSNYFQTPIPLLFTRRIVDPQWGVRLTGKDGPWAVGMLVADDASPGAEVAPDNSLFGKHAYFAVGRVSRDIGSQSSLGLMFTDREVGPYFNRVGGIDGRFKLNSNWVASFQGVVSSTLCSDTRNDSLQLGTYLAGPAAEVILQRDGRKLNYIMDYSDRSDGFRTFTGFDPQPDIHNLYHRLEYSFRPEGKHLISWGPQMEVYHTFDHEGNYLNSGYFPALKTEFVGQTFVNFYTRKRWNCCGPGISALLPAIRNTSPHHARLSSRPACTGRSRFIWTIASAPGSTMTRRTTSLHFWRGAPASPPP